MRNTLLKTVLPLLLSSILLLTGCTTLRLADKNEAALYSLVSAESALAPITYEYSIIKSVDGVKVAFDENPVFLSAGTHTVEIRYGRCVAPALIILCEFQPSKTKTVEFNFIGGNLYTLTLNGEITAKQ